MKRLLALLLLTPTLATAQQLIIGSGSGTITAGAPSSASFSTSGADFSFSINGSFAPESGPVLGPSDPFPPGVPFSFQPPGTATPNPVFASLTVGGVGWYMPNPFSPVGDGGGTGLSLVAHFPAITQPGLVTG